MAEVSATNEMRQRLDTITKEASYCEDRLSDAEALVIREKDRLRSCYALQDSYVATLRKLGESTGDYVAWARRDL